MRKYTHDAHSNGKLNHMNKKFTFLFFASLLFGQVAFSQSNMLQKEGTPLVEPCKTSVIMEELFRNNPALKADYDRQNAELARIIQEKQNGPQNKTEATDPMYVIPIVIHVIHTGQAIDAVDNTLNNCIPNPSNAKLLGSIDQVNKDFAALGKTPDNVSRNTRARDAKIKMCLARKGPTGTPYPDGAVIRYDGSLAATWSGVPSANRQTVANAYAQNGIGSNGATEAQLVASIVPWDVKKYYNIYLVTELDGNNSGSGTQGYAYYPGGGNDYSVMIPKSFDGTKGSIYIFDHEMGHALNLPHSFKGKSGDENGNSNTYCPIKEDNCATDGDYICDIPTHPSMLGLPRKDPASPNNCQSNYTGVYGDFQDNYMNYGNTDQNFFSADQVTRMRTATANIGNRKTQITNANVTYCGCDYLLQASADFEAMDTDVYVTDSVIFKNYSPNSTTYSWDFGDGQTSTEKEPIHQYAEPGDYTVKLDVDGGGGAKTMTKTTYITVRPATADFTATKKVVYTNTPVQFTDMSNRASSYAWDFGDGQTSTEKNPIHQYATGGKYTVRLDINGGGDTKTMIKTAFIGVIPDRSGIYAITDGGDFESNTNDFLPLTVSGTAWELGNSTLRGKSGTTSGSNAWVTGITENDIKNNSLSYLYTPNFDLSTPGTYTLGFSAKFLFEKSGDGVLVEYTTDKGDTWNRLGTAVVASTWYNDTAIASSGYPVGTPIYSYYISSQLDQFGSKSFNISTLSGNANVGFRFTLRSNNVAVTYSGNNYYTGMAIDNFRIDYSAAVSSNFSASSTNFCSGNSTVFTANTGGTVTSYLWNFGAGASPATANTKGPHTVTYSGSGSSTVSLTVNGSTTETKSNYITVKSLPASKTPVAENATVCSGEAANIRISSSENGVIYQLMDNSNNALVGNPVAGTGANINLPTDVMNGTKTFAVQAKKETCTQVFTDKVTIAVNQSPSNRPVAPKDPKMCLSNGGTEIEISNSESGMSYQLRKDADNAAVGSAVTGNGATISLPTGPVASTTKYNVLVSKSNCARVMDTRPTVTINSEPQGKDVRTEQANVCPGTSTVVIIENGENEVSYQLFDNASNTAIGDPVSGTGSNVNLPTGALGVDKVFRVEAFNGCTKAMNNTVEVKQLIAPADKTLSVGKSEVCSGTGTAVTIAAAETGVSYQLKNDLTNEAIGNPLTGAGSDINLPTGNLSSSVTYRVVGTRDGCSSTMGTKPSVAVISVDQTKVVQTDPTSLCDSGLVAVIVKSSENGVVYQLRDDVDGALIGSPITGNGANISLPAGMVNKKYTYNVLAAKGECKSVLNTKPTLLITGNPEVKITQSGKILIASSGGSNYKWYRNDTLLVGETKSSYTPFNSGLYKVEMTKGGCTGKSEAFSFIVNDIGEILSDKDIAVFPNPNNGTFNLVLDNGQQGELTVNVYNQIGQVVKTEKWNKREQFFQQTMDISSFANGVYYVEVISSEGRSRKIIQKGM